MRLAILLTAALTFFVAGCGPKATVTSGSASASAGGSPSGGGDSPAPFDTGGGGSAATSTGSIPGLLQGIPKDKHPKPGADGVVERNEAKEWLAKNVVGQSIEVSLPVLSVEIEDAGEGKYNINLNILTNSETEETKTLGEGVNTTKLTIGRVPCQLQLWGPRPLWAEVDGATAKKYRELKGKQVVLRAKIEDAEFHEGDDDKRLLLTVTLAELTPVLSPAPKLIAKNEPRPPDPDPGRPGGNVPAPAPMADAADDVTAAYAPLLALKKPKPKHAREIPRATPPADAHDVFMDEDKVLPRRRVIGEIRDGKPHGETRCYGPNRRLLMIENYENGVLHGDKLVFYPSGAQLAYYPMKNGKQDGVSYTWWENGNLADAISWKDGLGHGPQIIFFENGQPNVTATRVNGQAQGVRGYFNSDGKLFGITHWTNNVQGEINILDPVANRNAQFEAEQRSKVSFLAKDHWTYARMTKEKSTPHPGPDATKTGEWISLFNGKDLRGWWRSAPNTRYKDAWVKWEVVDGAIVGTGQRHNQWLITDEQYTNFHMRVEARIDAKGNSGIYFGVPNIYRYDYNLDLGYEANIALVDPPPTESSRAFPEPKVRTGGIYPVFKGVQNTDQVLHRANEWFTMEVIVRGQTIVTKVNGKITGEATVPANSTRPITTGHIALQVHYTPTTVAFRKVEIMRLPE